MKYVIWGSGRRGSRIFKHLGQEAVEAFLDMNPQKQGQECYGKKIISLETYKKEYLDCMIVISFLHDLSAGRQLQEKEGIDTYLLLSDCPGELQEHNARMLLKDYLISIIDEEKKYAILGCTIYSLILYDLIIKHCKHTPVLIVNANINPGILRLLVKYGYDYKYGYEKIDIEYDEMFGTEYMNSLKYRQFCSDNKKFRYIFDCSDMIEEYHNPHIEKFKNIHKGQRCFIVGLGPSLRMEDLDLLKKHNEVCFSVNRISEAFDRTGWRPTYYVTLDDWSATDFMEKIDDIEAEYKFISDVSPDYWKLSHDKNVMKFHLAHICAEARMPEFSEDFSRKSYMGYTVTYTCMQLAAYMGFCEIYLLGVDYTEGREYTHFYGDKLPETADIAEYVYMAYCSAKKYADVHGINIYNATRGGKLEVFDRVNFDNLF